MLWLSRAPWIWSSRSSTSSIRVFSSSVVRSSNPVAEITSSRRASDLSSSHRPCAPCGRSGEPHREAIARVRSPGQPQPSRSRRQLRDARPDDRGGALPSLAVSPPLALPSRDHGAAESAPPSRLPRAQPRVHRRAESRRARGSRTRPHRSTRHHDRAIYCRDRQRLRKDPCRVFPTAPRSPIRSRRQTVNRAYRRNIRSAQVPVRAIMERWSRSRN
jgi:hypothetical protein